MKLIVMQAIVQRTIKIMEERDDALAVRIANAVARTFGG
jgi:hypothetical protein